MQRLSIDGISVQELKPGLYQSLHFLFITEDLESNDKNIFCDEEPPNRGQTVFEVDSTEIIKEGRKGYVVRKTLTHEVLK